MLIKKSCAKSDLRSRKRYAEQGPNIIGSAIPTSTNTYKDNAEGISFILDSGTRALYIHATPIVDNGQVHQAAALKIARVLVQVLSIGLPWVIRID